MNDGVLYSFRHNAWATRELLAFCEQLTDEQLRATAIGTYGSIIETLNHMVGADAFYLSFFTGALPAWPWRLDGNASIAQLQASNEELAAGWENNLVMPVEANRELPAVNEAGRVERAGILIAQAIHHPNVHREQVNMMLTTLGIEPPDLDVWVYDWVVLKCHPETNF